MTRQLLPWLILGVLVLFFMTVLLLLVFSNGDRLAEDHPTPPAQPMPPVHPATPSSAHPTVWSASRSAAEADVAWTRANGIDLDPFFLDWEARDHDRR